MLPILLSIDAGSSSLRSALVTATGTILASDHELILTWNSPDRMEQSSDNIWQALVRSVNRLLTQNPVDTASIAGIGIDTTASIVLLNKELNPVSLPGNRQANIIGWRDMRAAMQANVLSQQHPQILKGMGARLTPENHTARLLWLQQQAPDLWAQTDCIVDLFDFLTMKCTGVISRTDMSLGTRTTKEEYLGFGIHTGSRLRGEIIPTGTAIANGLSPEAATQLGLPPYIPVAAGIIDGFGGMLSTVLSNKTDQSGNKSNELDLNVITKRLSMTVGTSSVYIATSNFARESPHYWGPWPSHFHGYYQYVIRQTSAGSLIDHIIQSHPAFNGLQNLAISLGISVYQRLNQLLTIMAKNTPLSELTKELHVVPWFSGNHCPGMHMSLLGMISGLRMDNSEESLALLYLATIQSLALGARHNIERLKDSGHEFDLLTAAGGLSKNPLFMQEHVNAMGIPAALPEEPDAMLLSGAIIAATASGVYSSIENAMRAMSRYKEVIQPDTEIAHYVEKKYQVFLEMYKDQVKYRRIMGNL